MRGLPACPECASGHARAVPQRRPTATSPPACRPASAATPAAAGARAWSRTSRSCTPSRTSCPTRTPCWSSRSPARCTPRGIADVQPGENVAIIGAGTIGLLTLAAVRESAPSATLICVAKHAGQQTAARRFGADDVCAPERLYIEGARITHSRRLVGHGNREMLLGGFDRVLDCVGSGTSIEQAITITRPRGRVVLVGMPGELKTDLAAAWLRELEIRAAYGYEHDFPARWSSRRSSSPVA